MHTDTQYLESLARLARYWIVRSTTQAGSGHPTSSFSATDLMVGLMFGGGFRYDVSNPDYPNNDRLIFSKGHAAPLYYALWAIAGVVTEEELLTLREFDSVLEGHPTMRFKYTEAATGSLGQGLSIGVGMALNAQKFDKTSYKTYVLLGDSEMAEGSVWEAFDSAREYNLNNLVAIVDVNRLGQRGETMPGHDLSVYRVKCEAFGWDVIEVDGHSMEDIQGVYAQLESQSKPTVILAKTYKGYGVSFVSDKDGWHGKALNSEEAEKAIEELGEIDVSLKGEFATPEMQTVATTALEGNSEWYPHYTLGEKVATRKAYGQALQVLSSGYENLIALDAEVSNSTYSEKIKEVDPQRFVEMYIAEQNMVGVALGLSRRGKKPFVSTFAAFFSRAFDQIRMAQYSDANIAFVGSHAGVSIGQDGSSQMAIEDIAMFRTILDGVVVYPSDAVSTLKLLEKLYLHQGISYMRTTRMETSVLYTDETDFVIGGSQTLRTSERDRITIVGAGVTLHEALKAYDSLREQGIEVRVIDLYSIQPLDMATLHTAARETGAILVVEDHGLAGGIGEAVRSALEEVPVPVYSLAVTKTPRSATPEELLAFEEIDAEAIEHKVKHSIQHA